MLRDAVRIAARPLGFVAVLALAAAFSPAARAASVLIESWENTQDGWTISPENSAYSSAGFSTTTGVTDQSFSWALAGTAGPTYGQMLDSPPSLANTVLLGQSSSLSIDVFCPPGSFGFFQQWSAVVNNADTGYTSLDGFAFSQNANIGGEKTLTWTMPIGVRNTLAASANPTTIIFQVGGGFSGGNETFYVDNLRATTVPEPMSAGVLAIGGLATLMRRKRS